MAKIKLSKNELKKQKDSLKRFERYLPTLQLKKQQLQMEVRRIEETLHKVREEYRILSEWVDTWVAVMGEGIDIERKIALKSVSLGKNNIAGVDIPVLLDVLFDTPAYDLFVTPLWVDAAVEAVKKIVTAKKKVEIAEEQYRLMREELTITTQRVNLFEKVKIPETKENIRIVQIYLGDEQVAGIVRGKIAKKKLVERNA
ncbi:MAG: V-type ATP synthase subunit D [Deltaproteobacteria bacterium]|nr:V-type ATP synthase subunit D [Deltaproteobacteria bacterium]